MTILDKIVAEKKETLKEYPEVVERASDRQPIPFKARVEAGDTLGIISEIKRASPSKGDINTGFTPADQALLYVEGGTNAISVLTESDFFKGSMTDLADVRGVVDVPILNKDFIIDERQIVDAYNHGADIILLIVTILDDETLARFHNTARDLGMEVIVEVHDEEEMKRALKLDPEIIGINNRDLKTFLVDLDNTVKLIDKYYDEAILFIAESGMETRADAQKMAGGKARCLLVGETLMRAKHPVEVIGELKVGI
ncbi:indole-3-glycerol phosphate synthase TrpC [Lacicoccus alkaliphilus]|uniref:Indole-3-glycerol phosphate synthase n=1 Tax=Lacicoccus alkaliphilus DSM 16010 TaxID=1123231 RepID=A0A1M7FM97_9BACL|nr:indole-3-glycerol phosphate synthase TrpC [Salinicoccus alkaliphilus]SHM04819.1 indole-3-glycerol phosphate synthase [Salinicoccus alkaliphilus DSM 16010]